jgi:hypothetical protein
VLLANTPFHDVMLEQYPKGFLSASGLDVGLPPGQMGNSEVGHLNLGAGRIVYQDLTRINKAIEEGTLANNPVFTEALEKAKSSRLHFIGLVSDGGVHSHQDQLIAMVKLAKQAGVNDIMIHAITDGRDTSPTGGEGLPRQGRGRGRQVRRAHRHRDRPLLRHGPRQALGPRQTRLGRHRARQGRTATSSPARPSPITTASTRPTSSCPR